MPRKLSKGYAGARKVSRVVGVSEGGTGKSTPLEAAANLKVISKLLLDQPNGYAVFDNQGNYPEKYFKKLQSIGFGSFSVSGPATVYVGSTNIFTVTNFDSFSAINVTVDIGAVVVNGNQISYTAPANVGTANLNVGGKIIQIAVADKQLYRPVVLFPMNNAMNVSPNLTLSLGRFDTFPEIPQAFITAPGNGDIVIPDNAIGVILRGKTDGTDQMTLSVNGDTVYFSDIETDQRYQFSFGITVNKMTLANVGTGYLEYSWIFPNDALSSTDWQIATDINFQHIINQITGSTVNKFTLPQALVNATQYYARARFNSQTEGSTAWSDAITFITSAVGYPGLEYSVPSYTEGSTPGALNSSWNTTGKWAALSGNEMYYATVASNSGADALFVYKKDSTDTWTNVSKINIAKPYKTTTNVCVNISYDGSVITVGWNTAGAGSIAVYTRDGSGVYSLLKTLTFSNVTYHAISKDGVKMSIVADAGSSITLSILKDFKNSNTATLIDTISTGVNGVSVAMSYDGGVISLIAASNVYTYKTSTAASGYSRDAVFGYPNTVDYALALSDDGNSMFTVANGPVTYYSRASGTWKLIYEIAVQETTTAQRRIATNGDGTRLLLGVPDVTRGTAANSGTAYVYIFDSGTWKLKRELLISDAYDIGSDHFGALVDISSDGTYAVVNHLSTTTTDTSGCMCNGFMYKPDPSAGLPSNPTIAFTTPGIYYVTIPDGYGTADLSIIGGAGGGGAGGINDSGHVIFENGASGGGGGSSAIINTQNSALLAEAVGGEGGNGGASVGNENGGNGGDGASTKKTIQIASGQVLKVIVGQGGKGALATDPNHTSNSGGIGGPGYAPGTAGSDATPSGTVHQAGKGGDNTQSHAAAANAYAGYPGPANFTITGPAGLGGSGGDGGTGSAGRDGANGQVTITLNPYPSGPVSPVINYWTPGTYDLIVPDGYTKLTYKERGGGGGGGGGYTNPASGGGSGYLSTGTINVTPGQHITVIVGQGGNPGGVSGNAGTPGGNGAPTKIIYAGITYTANGGIGGGADDGSPPGTGAYAGSAPYSGLGAFTNGGGAGGGTGGNPSVHSASITMAGGIGTNGYVGGVNGTWAGGGGGGGGDLGNGKSSNSDSGGDGGQGGGGGGGAGDSSGAYPGGRGGDGYAQLTFS